MMPGFRVRFWVVTCSFPFSSNRKKIDDSGKSVAQIASTVNETET